MLILRLAYSLRHGLSCLILIFAICACCAGAAAGLPDRGGLGLLKLDPGSNTGWVLADLDRDGEPDLASGKRVSRSEEGYLYQIDLQLSSGKPTTSFTFSHTDALGLRIFGIDIDGDQDIDLIISGRFTKDHTRIWLNDGKGRFVESPTGLFSSNAPWAYLSSPEATPDKTVQAADVRSFRRLFHRLPTFEHHRPSAFFGSVAEHPIELLLWSAADPSHSRAPPSLTL